LLVVALLMISAQPGVGTVTTVFDGDRDLPGGTDAVVVAGGDVTLPTDARASTSLYVLGGTARLNGTLDGRVVQLAGNVTVGSAGTVAGRYRIFGGTQEIDDGADVRPAVIAEPITRERSPLESVGIFLLQALTLAVVSFALGGRYSPLLTNVSHSIGRHPLVSGTMGFLTIVTLLALFVFMAFTIVLIPVSLLGLVAGVLVVLYAYVSVGFLLGQRLPIDRPGIATSAGTILFLLANRLLSAVPVVGETISLAIVVVATGAVFITYFGLREFQPPQLRPVD
jgi:hypothetical protein